MDWSKQTQDMLKSWSETQKKMWDAWLSGLQATGPSAATDAWQKTIDTWQKSVNDTFDAQARLTKLWLQGLKSTPAGTGSAAEWTKQAEQMFERLQHSQRQLWESCFTALKKADLRKMPGAWEQQARQIFQNWQDAARRAMEAQAELIDKLGKR